MQTLFNGITFSEDQTKVYLFIGNENFVGRYAGAWLCSGKYKNQDDCFVKRSEKVRKVYPECEIVKVTSRSFEKVFPRITG